eukprot:TRINITY_DN25109_c0_g1_i1.p1 TRINITY_DN25109_c0_g1~~TRINITY_DN25109_c0_g1_i1.p1  ORF type:complete len:315 (+),score=34.96 TRINITY_DN25109_c0_g1_i1:48-992(+)
MVDGQSLLQQDPVAVARISGPLCIVAGTAVGAAAVYLGLVGPALATLVTVVLLIAASTVIESNSVSVPLISAGCFVLGLVLGFGSSASALSALSYSTKDGTIYWSLEGFGGSELTADVLKLPLFFTLVMLFHAFEFLFVVCFHPSEVSFGSLMLCPVPYGGYAVAMIAALAEFWIEMFFGRLQILPPTVNLAILCIGALGGFLGWALRVVALFTAKANFTHQVAHYKMPTHQLVTSGVYQHMRHPGYVGWFLWSVSTQIVLGNTLCFFAYVRVTWKFFADRIPDEETALVGIFGQVYRDYAANVPCGIPGISLL